MALDDLAKRVRALHEAVMSDRLEDSDLDTISGDEIAGKLDTREYKHRKIQLQNAMNSAVGGTNYQTYDDPRTEMVVYYGMDKRREPSALRAVKTLPWAAVARRDVDEAGKLELTISVNPDNMLGIGEAVMGNPITMGRTSSSVEAVKRAVDPSHPTEPIENNGGDAPAGPEGAKPSFEAMVDTAKAALLDRKDPHEAVEALLGEGEPEDETQIVQAVEAALNMLDIQEKELEPEGGEQV